MTYLEALILAIIEGITEFLPVSSTGHMVIASTFMGISNNTLTKNFEIVIQLGAILSVVVLYWRKFFTAFRFYLKLALHSCLLQLLVLSWKIISTIYWQTYG